MVEDQVAVLDTVSRMLSRMGFSVTPVANGSDAITALEHDDNFDLLLSDVVLPPPIDGVALAAQARRMAPHLCIVLTSGYPEDRLNSARLPDFDDFIVKPYGSADLQRRLSLLLPNARPGRP